MDKEHVILTVEYASNNVGKVLSNHELRKVRVALGVLAGYITTASLVIDYMPDADGSDTIILLRNVHTA